MFQTVTYRHIQIDPADDEERRFTTTSTPRHIRLIRFAKALWGEIERDHVFDGAAVLAFFFLLAVFPATIFVLSILPVLSIPHLQQAMVDLLHQVLPHQAANFFDQTVGYVGSEGKHGLLTFGLIATLWSGSSGVYAMMQQLDIVCDVKERRPFWKVRAIAILLLVFFILLAIASLSLVIFAGVVQSGMASFIGWSRPLLFFFATLAGSFLRPRLLALAAAYRFAPDASTKFRFVSPGNLVAAVLIALASIGFRFYVFKFGNYSATYGSLAAIVILMLWMYMAGIALLVGSEINTMLHPHNFRRPALNDRTFSEECSK